MLFVRYQIPYDANQLAYIVTDFIANKLRVYKMRLACPTHFLACLLSMACQGMVSWYLTTTGWEVLPDKEVFPTSHRDQVGGAKVRKQSCGGLVKYEKCLIFRQFTSVSM